MNPYEVDVMKLTPEDYLKMRDRCRELEDKKKQQADYILELERRTPNFQTLSTKCMTAAKEPSNCASFWMNYLTLGEMKLYPMMRFRKE